MMELENFVKVVTLSLASVVEGLSALFIAFAALRTALLYVKSVVQTHVDKTELRIRLGKSLALALEFLLAAD